MGGAMSCSPSQPEFIGDTHVLKVKQAGVPISLNMENSFENKIAKDLQKFDELEARITTVQELAAAKASPDSDDVKIYDEQKQKLNQVRLNYLAGVMKQNVDSELSQFSDFLGTEKKNKE